MRKCYSALWVGINLGLRLLCREHRERDQLCGELGLARAAAVRRHDRRCGLQCKSLQFHGHSRALRPADQRRRERGLHDVARCRTMLQHVVLPRTWPTVSDRCATVRFLCVRCEVAWHDTVATSSTMHRHCGTPASVLPTPVVVKHVAPSYNTVQHNTTRCNIWGTSASVLAPHFAHFAIVSSDARTRRSSVTRHESAEGVQVVIRLAVAAVGDHRSTRANEQGTLLSVAYLLGTVSHTVQVREWHLRYAGTSPCPQQSAVCEGHCEVCGGMRWS